MDFRINCYGGKLFVFLSKTSTTPDISSDIPRRPFPLCQNITRYIINSINGAKCTSQPRNEIPELLLSDIIYYSIMSPFSRGCMTEFAPVANRVLKRGSTTSGKLRRNEPRHDKTNKMTVRPAKTRISLGIRQDWSVSLLCAQWVTKDPRFLHADSEDSDQTVRMSRLIWVIAGRTATVLVFSCRGSNETALIVSIH